MNGYTFLISQTSASLRLHNKTKSDKGHYPLLHRVLNLMADRGFEVGRDPEIQKHYSILNKDHWYGKKGHLEFKAHRYPSGFELQFFQNKFHENPHGGCYDFDKFEKMPYLIKLLFKNEVRYIKNFLESCGVVDISSPVYKTAEDKIKSDFVESWHHPQKSIDFNLSDLDGQTCEGSYNNTDKDKKTIYNGQVKYFRDRKGRLMRGRVYHNINSMWWVILNKLEYWNIANFQLFDLTPDNNIRKLIRRSGHHNPKSRWIPSVTEIKQWQKVAKKHGKDGRIEVANDFLRYLYSIDWMSRCFQFILKGNGRLELVEPEGRPNFSFLGIPRSQNIYNPPKKIPLYPVPKQMSGTESSWVKSLREYVVHGPGPRVSSWFCRDGNGAGSSAHHWPEVREKLIKLGAMVINVAS